MLLPEAGDERGRVDRAHGRDGAEGDAAAVERAQAVDLGAQRVGLLQHPPGADEHGLAGRGEADGAARARHELDAQLLLQAPHLLAQGGLHDVQLLGRAREARVTRDGLEVAELAEFHGG